MLYNDLKTIADSLNTPNKFVYYNPSNANVEAGEVLPGEIFIVLDSPTVINGNISRSMVFRDVLSLRLFFFSNYSESLDYHTQTDDNSEQRDNIQNKTLGVAKEFLLRYIKEFPYMDESTGSLESISYSFESVEFEFNANMHGVRLDVSLPVVLPFDYCLTPPPPPYQPQIEYTNLLNYWVQQGFEVPTEEQQLIQDTLVKELKEAGIWQELYSLNIFLNNNVNTSFTDWVLLEQAQDLNGSISFIENVGIKGNTINAKLLLPIIPNQVQDIDQNAFSHGVLVYEKGVITSDTQGTYFMGASGYDGNSTGTIAIGGYQSLFGDQRIYSNSFTVLKKDGTAPGTGGPTDDTFYIVNRENNVVDFYGNETLIKSFINNSTGVDNFNISLFNSGLNPSIFSDATIQISFVGGNLKGKEAQLNTIIRKYLTDIVA